MRNRRRLLLYVRFIKQFSYNELDFKKYPHLFQLYDNYSVTFIHVHV